MTLGLIGMIPVYTILVGWTGGNGIANLETILLVGLICVGLTLMLSTSHSGTRALLIVLVLALTIRFLQRLVVITAYPEVIDFRMFLLPGEAEMNRTLLFLGLGIIAMYLGFVVGGSFIRRHTPKRFVEKTHLISPLESTEQPQQNKYSLYQIRKLLYLTSFIFLTIHFVLRFVAQEGLSGVASGPLGWLSQLLPSTGFLVLNVILFERHRSRLQTGDKVIIITYVTGFFLMLTVQGVRGAAVSIILVWLITVIALTGNPKIFLKHVAASLVVLVVLLVFFFDFAWAIRSQWTTYGTMDMGNLIPTYEAARGRHDMFWVSKSNSGFDRLMVVTNYAGIDPGMYLNTSNLVKSSLSNFIPRAIWEPDTVSSVRAFPALYRFYMPRTAANAIKGLHGEYWTIFAWMYGYLGYIGGLVGLFLFGALSAYLLGLVWTQTSDWGLFARAWLLSSIYSCVSSGNLDVIVSSQLVAFIVISVFVKFLQWSAHPATLNQRIMAPNAK